MDKGKRKKYEILSIILLVIAAVLVRVFLPYQEVIGVIILITLLALAVFFYRSTKNEEVVPDKSMSEATIKTQMGLLVETVRYIQMKNVLTEIDPEPKLNFWCLIHGGFMDLPCLDWCKIFGSNAEPTHWKGIVKDIDQFKKDLLKYLEITQKEWESYWFHIKDYRDKLVAHNEVKPSVEKYPSLDIALRSSYFYYDYLENLLNEGKVEPIEPLEEYSEQFYKQAQKVAKTAIGSTKDIDESVY